MLSKNEYNELLNADISNCEEYIGFLFDTRNDKTAPVSFTDMSKLLSEKFGVKRSRRWFERHQYDYAENSSEQCNEDISDVLTTELEDKIRELKKAKVQLSDERVQNNAYVRILAREESIKEIARYYADKMAENSQLLLKPYKTVAGDSQVEGILCISDWHYGLDFSNPFNTFNPEVAVKRVNQLTDAVIDYIKQDKISTLHVLNLGDLIAGRIHLTIRIESRFDVITQVMNVSEIVAEMLCKLSQYCKVDYRSVTDNHSRLDPDKKEALQLESLARIVDWYVKQRLNGYVPVYDNEFGDDIITFKCLGHNILGVHGDNDNHITMVDKLSMMTKTHYDLVLAAHLHHFSSEEKNETISLGNSSLMGTDSYAQKLRLTSRPSQNLIVVTPKNITSTIHRIILD